MRVLIFLSNNSGNGFLVKLHNNEVIDEIKKLIFMRDNPKAMITALTKGLVECEVAHHEAHTIEAELVLTRDRVSWDFVDGGR